jgi:putative tryptophan/tyrosine transport system substrate-binding protein
MDDCGPRKRAVRRRLLLTGLGATMAPLAVAQTTSPAIARASRPYRIYCITFRGMTEVERGFRDYLATQRIPVELTYRDIDRDVTRVPALLEEIRATRPDLIYTWGTSVTLAVVGPYDSPNPERYINDIPVLFTLVAAPTLAKIVRDTKAPRRNVSGVTHVGSTEAQIRAMRQYRPFDTLGILYTSTEANSVAVLSDIRQLGRADRFQTVERSFRLDANRKPIAEGAADLVREIRDAGAQWLYLPPDTYLGTVAERVVVPTATELGLPTFASTEQLMQAGALLGLVCRYYNLGQFTAHKAERILVGKDPISKIAVETLSRFSYQVRLSAARRLKLLPPMSMLGYAELVGGSGFGP